MFFFLLYNFSFGRNSESLFKFLWEYRDIEAVTKWSERTIFIKVCIYMTVKYILVTERKHFIFPSFKNTARILVTALTNSYSQFDSHNYKVRFRGAKSIIPGFHNREKSLNKNCGSIQVSLEPSAELATQFRWSYPSNMDSWKSFFHLKYFNFLKLFIHSHMMIQGGTYIFL